MNVLILYLQFLQHVNRARTNRNYATFNTSAFTTNERHLLSVVDQLEDAKQSANVVEMVTNSGDRNYRELFAASFGDSNKDNNKIRKI